MNPKKSILACILALFATVLLCTPAFAEAAVPTKFPTAQILIYAGIFSALLIALVIIHLIAAGDRANENERKGVFVLPIILTLAAALAPVYGLRGVWTAMAIELTFRGIIFLARLFRGNWQKGIAREEDI